MIKIKSKKIHNSPDNKSFTYYLTFENDPVEYELNYNYSNSCFYKGNTATLSIVSNNFCKAILVSSTALEAPIILTILPL